MKVRKREALRLLKRQRRRERDAATGLRPPYFDNLAHVRRLERAQEECFRNLAAMARFDPNTT